MTIETGLLILESILLIVTIILLAYSIKRRQGQERPSSGGWQGDKRY